VVENAASSDKSYIEIDADHFGFKTEGERDGGIPEAAAAIVDWLRPRFAAVENPA
jgi:hypothetical protein